MDISHLSLCLSIPLLFCVSLWIQPQHPAAGSNRQVKDILLITPHYIDIIIISGEVMKSEFGHQTPSFAAAVNISNVSGLTEVNEDKGRA